MIDTVAQSAYKNYLYIEGAGKSIYYSLNYERQCYGNDLLKINARLGTSFLIYDKYYESLLTINYGLSVLYGSTAHKIEIGLGQTYAFLENPSPHLVYIKNTDNSKDPQQYKFENTKALQTYLDTQKYANNEDFRKLNYAVLNTVWSAYMLNTFSAGYRWVPNTSKFFLSANAILFFFPINIANSTALMQTTNFITTKNIYLHFGIGAGIKF
ncbi:MAG: hypothetical protein NW207_00540 [Cytophagales bacterium]|nr:hypothetical protein [Cytophagales bacterium]